MKKRSLAIYLPAAAAAVLITSAAVLRIFLDLPVSAPPSGITIIIPPRATTRDVAAILERMGVIPRDWLFTFWVRLLGLDSHLRYGEYTFTGPLSLKAVIDILVSGRTTLHKLTIPEGYTVADIARAVEEAGLGSANEITRTARDPAFLRRWLIDGPSAEGFCFPDTYYLPRDWPADKLLGKMISRFYEVFDEGMRRQANDMNMTVLGAVTLASIIEKESGLAEELPLISAVFHNRLRRGIPLMADPAVIYGLPDFDGNLRKTDLKRPGPYNLYLNKGLPPGPIANPGRKALAAALTPAAVKYLYFVSKNNGSHQFSRTLSEHNQAVALYQRAGREATP